MCVRGIHFAICSSPSLSQVPFFISNDAMQPKLSGPILIVRDVRKIFWTESRVIIYCEGYSQFSNSNFPQLHMDPQILLIGKNNNKAVCSKKGQFYIKYMYNIHVNNMVSTSLQKRRKAGGMSLHIYLTQHNVYSWGSCWSELISQGYHDLSKNGVNSLGLITIWLLHISSTPVYLLAYLSIRR